MGPQYPLWAEVPHSCALSLWGPLHGSWPHPDTLQPLPFSGHHFLRWKVELPGLLIEQWAPGSGPAAGLAVGTLLAAGPVAGQMGLPLSPLAQTPQEQGDQAGLRLRREGFVPGQCPAESRCQLLLMTEDPKSLASLLTRLHLEAALMQSMGGATRWSFPMSMTCLESQHSLLFWQVAQGICPSIS